MNKNYLLIALLTLAAGILTSEAATQQRKQERKRDGSCQPKVYETSLMRRSGNGNGSGDRKRDGTGDVCKVSNEYTPAEYGINDAD